MQGTTESEISSVVYDTRNEIGKGACFVCISGTKFDGHEYAETAAKNGATAIIAEKPVHVPENVTVILVDNCRKALAYISAAYFGYPAQKIKLVGITGTKGKTTTACMIKEALIKAGYKTDLIGTIEITIDGKSIPASHTTPESYLLQEYFAKMVEAGTEYCVMEVSSQGLKLDRVAGIVFDIGVFTNLEPDHIAPGEHPDFADYLYCKSLLFRQCRVGVGNIDDEHFDEIFENSTCKIVSYGRRTDADYCASDISLWNRNGSIGVEFNLRETESHSVNVGIPGFFNAYNALAAITALFELGIDKKAVLEALKSVKVRGRVEPVEVSDKFNVMLDYAHNGMSLRSLLTTLREYNPGRLVCMFGCGGNRAKDRRYDMGEMSAKLADVTIITSDNPRYEEPQEIINDIITGINRVGGEYKAIIDRREAIKYCLANAKPGDLIVIAGKGHENYQEICGVKYPMDDRKMILEAAHELDLC